MRYIGVDLYTNSFIVCYLEGDMPRKTQILSLQKGGLEEFIKTL